MLLRYMFFGLLLSAGLKAEDGIDNAEQRERALIQWIVDLLGTFERGEQAAPSRAAQNMADIIERLFPHDGSLGEKSIFNGQPRAKPVEFLQTSFEFAAYLRLKPAILSALAFVYMIKLKQNGFMITRTNWNRLYLASFLAANKYYVEKPITDKHFSLLLGMEFEDVKEMLRVFLTLMDFKLYISEEEFKAWLTLASEEQRKEGSTRKEITSGPPSPVRKDKPENPEIN